MATDTIKIKVEIDDNNATTNLKNVKDNLKAINKELETVSIGSDRYKELTQEASKFNTILKESKVNAKSINAVEGSLQSMKNELKQSLQAIKNMAQGTASYDEMLKKIQRLNFEIKEGSDELKDFNFAQGVIGDFTELGGAVTQVAGGISMLGLEGNKSLEEITQTMSRVMGAMQLFEGIRKSQIAIEKAYGSAVALTDKAMKILDDTTKATMGKIVLIVAAITAVVVVAKMLYDVFKKNSDNQKEYNKAIDGTIIKDEKLRESYNAHIKVVRELENQYGLLTGTLTEHEVDLKNVEIQYQESMKKIKENLEKTVEENTDLWSALKSTLNGGVDASAYINIVKATEQANEEMRRLREENEKRIEIENLKSKRKYLLEVVDKAKKIVELEESEKSAIYYINSKGLVNVYNLYANENKKLERLIAVNNYTIKRLKEENLQEDAKNYVDYGKTLANQQLLLKTKMVDIENRANEKMAELRNKVVNSEIALMKDGSDKQIEIAKQRQIEIEKTLNKEESQALTMVANTQEAQQKVRDYYNDLKINSDKLTQKELEKIAEDEANRILRISEEYAQKVKDLQFKSQEDKFKIYDNELKKIEDNNELQIDMIQTQIATKVISEKEGEAKIYNIQKQAIQNRIDSNKGYYDNVVQINKDLIKNEENRLKELQGITDEKEIERINKKYDNTEKELNNQLEQYSEFSDEYLTAVDELNDLEIEKEKDKNKKLIDEAKKREEAFKAIKQASFEALSQGTDAYYQMEAEKRAYDLESANAKINDQYNFEKRTLDENLKNGIINQNKYDETLKKLDTKKRQDERKLKEDNWKSEQEQKKSMIYTDTAIGIVKAIALSAPNFLQGAIAAAAVAASSAIQLSVINKQKMPKFEYGGMVGGQTHSNGGTMIEAEKGEYIVNKKAMQNADNKAVVTAVNNNQPINIVIDENQLRKVVNEIVSIPVTVLEADITKSQRKVKLLNNNSNL